MENLPNDIIWDLTYACPLRCGYCYSESGRRQNKEQDIDTLMAIADKIVSLNPERVAFSGGEPLLVKSVFTLANYLKSHGIRVTLYTSGFTINSNNVSKVLANFPEIRVSLDCHISEINDSIRGKKGGTKRALNAISLLLDSRNPVDNTIGVDTVVVNDNLPHLVGFCRHMAANHPTLDFINMGVAIPSGLANVQSFASHHLLRPEQLEVIRQPSFLEKLREAFIPERANAITLSDNFQLLMSPKDIEKGKARVNAIQIEPDGYVRGSLIYEGTVGHILKDDISEIIAEIQCRLTDSFYMKQLHDIENLQQWAVAARSIDLYYTKGLDHKRVSQRHNDQITKIIAVTNMEAAC